VRLEREAGDKAAAKSGAITTITNAILILFVMICNSRTVSYKLL